MLSMGRTASTKASMGVYFTSLKPCKYLLLKRNGSRVVRLRGHSYHAGHRGPKPPWRYQNVHVASAATSGVRTALSAPVLPDLQRAGHNAPNSTQLLRLHLQSRDILLEGGMPLLEGLSAHGYVQSVSSDSMVLGFKSPSGATNMVDIAVGKLACRRFMAGARNKLWWMVPEWGSAASDLPPETQFLLVELREGGPYAVVLPLIDNNTFRGTLRGRSPTLPHAAESPLILRMDSGDEAVKGSQWDNALYLAAGWDPYQLVELGVAGSAALSGTAKPRTQKKLPASLDVFGWCTWDAFYSRVSALGLHEGLARLVQGGVPPRLLIIDDGWQCTDVDPPLRPPMPDLPLPKKVAERVQETLLSTKDEFVEAELEMLYMGTKDIPAGSELGVALQQVAADQDHTSLEHHMKKTTTAPAGGEDELDRLLPWRKEKKQRRSARAAASEEFLASSNFPPSAPSLPSLDPQGEEEEAVEPSEGGPSMSPQARVGGPSPSKQASEAAAVSRREAGQLPQAGPKETPPDEETGKRAVTKLVEARSAGTGAASSSIVRNSIEPEVKIAEPVKEDRMNLFVWLVSAVAQRGVGLVYGLAQILVVKFYQYVVEPAKHNSWPVRFFANLACGPFRQPLLEFYATSGDFSRRLTDIRANSKFSSPFATPDDYFSGLPPRLDLVVQSLRDSFGVKYVYCWHGLSAYWSGVAPPSAAPEAAKYQARIVYSNPPESVKEIEPSMAWNPSVVSGIGVVEDVRQLYYDMHSYLAQSGVTGVKVDCQAGVGLVGSTLGGGPYVASHYQAALEDSIARHFPGNHAINCMCHSTENIYRMRDTAVARVSDDFYPRDPASSSPHIASCAYNSLFLGALLQPDWDMFHSHHPAARLHAAARAVSGGAVYVSDAPGKHDFDVLRQLVLPDGSVFRGLLPGRPTRDSLFKDPLRDGQSLLKVWNVNRHTGVVAVFHLQGSSWDRKRRRFVIHDSKPTPLSTQVRAADVDVFNPLAANGGQQPLAPHGFVACRQGSSELLRLRHAEDAIPITLEGGESAIVTIAPVFKLKGVEVAALGLSNMLNGGGAVTFFHLEAVDASVSKESSKQEAASTSGVLAHVGMKGPGEFVLYCSKRPLSCLIDRTPSEVQYQEEGRLVIKLPYGARVERELRLLF